MSGESDKFLSEPWSLNQLYCCLFSHHSQFGDKVTIYFRDSYYRNRKSVFIGDARTKQLPLARKKNVLGHVAKRKWAHSLALCNSVFPSRFFSVVDLWLSLLVQHDKDKVYRLCFSHRAKTFHFHLQKNPPSPCDFWLASGTWRNVMTCASLGDVSYRPLEPNSNTFPDSSNCFPRLRKETVYLFR